MSIFWNQNQNCSLYGALRLSRYIVLTFTSFFY